MPSFVSKSLCRGHRPRPLASVRYYHRQDQVARLLKERSVARFVVAPSGYGKTCLAIEYAETMFGFAHTFWFNGKSPCFMRDLDAGGLSETCADLDPELKLVVVDDLPLLDQARAEAFSREIDKFLDKGREVLVTCVPSCDMLAGLQGDRVAVRSRDLLLSEEELNASAAGSEGAAYREPIPTDAGRVASLAWGSSSALLSEGFKEQVPSDVLLTMGCAYLLGKGSFSDLAELGALCEQDVSQIASDYPHLGFDERMERFETFPFEIEDVIATVKPRLDTLVAQTRYESRDSFVAACAERLKAGGRHGRACDVVRLMGSLNARSSWLDENAMNLVENGCFLPTLLAVRSLASPGGRPERPALVGLEALCLYMLGDLENACKRAKRYAMSAHAPAVVRVVCLAVLARCGSIDVVKEALEELDGLAGGLDIGADGLDGIVAVTASACRARMDGIDGLLPLWKVARTGKADDKALCLLASWLFDAFEAGKEHMLDDRVRDAERFVRTMLSGADKMAPDFFASSAGLAMEHAHERGLPLAEGPLPTSTLLSLRKTEILALAQRQEFEEHSRREALRNADWRRGHPDLAFDLASSQSSLGIAASVPVLTIDVLGTFEVRIGDESLAFDRFRRQTVRALLALLVVNLGREVSRSSVCKALWPDSSEQVAKKNFYTVWSQLKRTLTLSDGTCPYLVLHQMGCRLESRYVRSDVSRLDEICREFLFGEPDYDQWVDYFIEIDRDFTGDFLPCEDKNPLVLQTREEIRARLVDALVSASLGIVSLDCPRQGIWFARAAIEHDRTREDAYVALMKAQLACGQRTAAMATFLQCRDVLNEELGVDPSSEAMQLYQEMLDADAK